MLRRALANPDASRISIRKVFRLLTSIGTAAVLGLRPGKVNDRRESEDRGIALRIRHNVVKE